MTVGEDIVSWSTMHCNDVLVSVLSSHVEVGHECALPGPRQASSDCREATEEPSHCFSPENLISAVVSTLPGDILAAYGFPAGRSDGCMLRNTPNCCPMVGSAGAGLT